MPKVSYLISFWLVFFLNLGGGLTSSKSYLVMAKTNDLAIPQTDPLLPPSNVERELSPLEKKRVKAEILNLEATAQDQWQQGNSSEAWQLWFRQLRLYRALGQLAETEALGRVGERAWQNNQGAELKVISDRLNTIFQQVSTENNADSELLSILATAAQKVRNLDTAIAIYQNLYAKAQKIGKKPQEQLYLEQLGKLYLSKFDYGAAATVYETLFFSAFNNSNSTDNNYQKRIEQYGTQLSKIYEYLQATSKAISLKEQLISYYAAQNLSFKIANLQLSLGDDYQSIQEFDLAQKTYQSAREISKSQQQIALFNEALSKLSLLYQGQGEYALAIETGNELIASYQAIGDLYGTINGHENLGQIYLQQEDYDSAVLVFSQALNIAESLNYKVKHLTSLLQKSKEKIK